MFNKLKIKLKKWWKGLLTFIGVGAVALALTIPNGAVEVPCKDDTSKAINVRISDCPVPANEKASFKGKEIARQVKSVARTNIKFSEADYDIEITETKAIENGVEIYARAWTPDGKQVGFGKDGSVDLERFRFINPPILVDDPNGSIVREWTDEDTGELKQRKLREDLQEAILHSLAHIIKVKKQKFGSEDIIRNKTGNTTTTLFPSGVDSVAPVDGEPQRAGVNEIISTIVNGAGTDAPVVPPTVRIQLSASSTTDQFVRLRRGGYGFTIPSDLGTIDSAIFSIFGSSKLADLGTPNIDLVTFTPDAATTLVAGDYAVANWGTTLLATSIAHASFSVTAYNNYTLNASGITHIETSGNRFFGSRVSWDTDVSFGGTWADGATTSVVVFGSVETGTTKDPKLVIEHTAAAGGKPRRLIIFNDLIPFKFEQQVEFNLA